MPERDPRMMPYPGDKLTDSNGWSFKVVGVGLCAGCQCDNVLIRLQHTNNARDGQFVVLPLPDFRLTFEDATVNATSEA